ncbi:MAG: nucleotide exchange factor GrpE [Chthoniobacterales bacterium]
MPANSEITLSDEFASTMQQLVAEAEKTIAPADFAASESARVDSQETRADFAALNARITELERALANGFANMTSALPAENTGEQLQRMDQHLITLCKTESVNQRLFNSLHEELKSYRDNFLRESLQKPFIRDLVILLDDLTSLASQMETARTVSEKKKGAVTQWSDNLQNAIHALVEVLHRMEVNEIEPMEKVDRRFHRVVSYEPADFAEDDGRIVMRVKRGFIWHDQVLRPEEVVAKRFS